MMNIKRHPVDVAFNGWDNAKPPSGRSLIRHSQTRRSWSMHIANYGKDQRPDQNGRGIRLLEVHIWVHVEKLRIVVKHLTHKF
jgi:hypothetical protein